MNYEQVNNLLIQKGDYLAGQQAINHLRRQHGANSGPAITTRDLLEYSLLKLIVEANAKTARAAEIKLPWYISKTSFLVFISGLKLK